MTEVLLYHHIQGLTDGVKAFAEDLPAARELAESTPQAELFVYPGERHLFADSSLEAFDEDAASLLRERVHSFLGRL